MKVASLRLTKTPMLIVFCPCCGAELNSPGGVLAIPRLDIDHLEKVDRHVFCTDCHPKFMDLVGSSRNILPSSRLSAVYITPPTEDGGGSEMWYVPIEVAANVFKYNLICGTNDKAQN